MTDVEALALKVIERMSLHGPLQLEELGKLLQASTWNQMFLVVDWLNREERLEIMYPDQCIYVVRLRTPSQRSGRLPSRQSGGVRVNIVADRRLI